MGVRGQLREADRLPKSRSVSAVLGEELLGFIFTLSLARLTAGTGLCLQSGQRDEVRADLNVFFKQKL